MPRQGLFRKQALEKLHSTERLDVMLAVDRPKHWLAIGAVGVLIAVALAWSVWGSIPVRVRGRGVFVEPGAVTPLQASKSGTVLRVLVAEGDRVASGQVLIELGLPSQTDLPPSGHPSRSPSQR